MRLRIFVGGKAVRDLKVPKDQRAAISEGMADLERGRDRLLEPMSLTVADIKVDGMLKSIERVKENGEEVIVLQFWENS